MIGSIMRTTINVDDKIFAKLMKFTKARTKTEAVNKAIDEWVEYKKRQRIKRYRGKLILENNIKQLRALDVEELSDNN